MHDLAVIVVSTNEAKWLRPCLGTVFEHAGSASLEVVVADNCSTDGTRELVETEFPEARVVTCENRGFSHANNGGWLTCDARYALFLNPDTEIVDGTFGDLVQSLDERPAVGLAGVRQLTGDGALYPTIRRFPNAVRTLGEALGSERWPFHPAWSGERVLDLGVYDTEVPCDWTSGSFMLARREALLSAGTLDERFFIYSEETDLCYRIAKAGWEVRHLPSMTIVHHAAKGGVSERMTAQDVYSRLQYGRKHFGLTHRVAYRGAIVANYVARALVPGSARAPGRKASRRALRILVGGEPPPFGTPPQTALPAAPDDLTSSPAVPVRLVAYAERS